MGSGRRWPRARPISPCGRCGRPRQLPRDNQSLDLAVVHLNFQLRLSSGTSCTCGPSAAHSFVPSGASTRYKTGSWCPPPATKPGVPAAVPHWLSVAAAHLRCSLSPARQEDADGGDEETAQTERRWCLRALQRKNVVQVARRCIAGGAVAAEDVPAVHVSTECSEWCMHETPVRPPSPNL